MKKIFLFVVALSLILFIPGAMAEDCLQGVSCTITPTEETDEYKITIQISNVTAGGLSIEFPGNFEIRDTNIPIGHYRGDDETLIVALTGQKSIHLDVICPKLASGDILTVWEDLAEGTKGGDELSFKESEETQKTNVQYEDTRPGDPITKESPFGISGISAILSLVIAGYIVTPANKKPMQEDEWK
ncbi:MAG: hypothetical protein WC346_13705 [Methanogenium sp.]